MAAAVEVDLMVLEEYLEQVAMVAEETVVAVQGQPLHTQQKTEKIIAAEAAEAQEEML
jgi:sulfur carrier protein ThiS